MSIQPVIDVVDTFPIRLRIFISLTQTSVFVSHPRVLSSSNWQLQFLSRDTQGLLFRMWLRFTLFTLAIEIKLSLIAIKYCCHERRKALSEPAWASSFRTWKYCFSRNMHHTSKSRVRQVFLSEFEMFQEQFFENCWQYQDLAVIYDW